MVKSGVDPYQAGEKFKDSVVPFHPVWCAQRFGQSITFLPGRRIVQIGGEHEDGYDPDFCIYNDVFVHGADGKIKFYGYPRDIFPPTDFHTANLLNGSIWIIGSLGYAGTRLYGETPIYRLDTESFKITKMRTSGNSPGWIYKHVAVQSSAGVIEVSKGIIVTASGPEELYLENHKKYNLDTERLEWSEGS